MKNNTPDLQKITQKVSTDEQNTLLIRVDANSSIGAGHLMRCIALAYGFQHYQLVCTFLVDDETEHYLQGLDDFPFEIKKNDQGDLDEVTWIKSVATSINAIGIVLDGYQFYENFRSKLSTIGLPIIAIDDTNTGGKLFADVVINPISSASTLNYDQTASGATLLLGSDYILLRPEFIKMSESDKSRSISGESYRQRQRCLITFGASDVAGLTIPVLEALAASQVGVSPITLVTGGAYPSNKQLKALTSNLNDSLKSAGGPSIIHLENVSNMAPVIQSAKMAISAAGGTVFELAAMGVPTLLLVVADNQLNAALEQQEKGWCQVIDARQSLSIPDLISAAQHLWGNNELRLEMHRKAIQHAVTDGAQRAASEIIRHINTKTLGFK